MRQWPTFAATMPNNRMRPEAETVGDPEVGAMLAKAFIRQGLPMIDIAEAPPGEGAGALKLLVDRINGDKHVALVQEFGVPALVPLRSANNVAPKDNAEDSKPEWRSTDAARAGPSALAGGRGGRDRDAIARRRRGQANRHSHEAHTCFRPACCAALRIRQR